MLIQFLYYLGITQSKVRKSILKIKKNVQMEKLTFIFSSGFCFFPEIKFQSLLIPLSFKTDQKNPFNGIFPVCNNHDEKIIIQTYFYTMVTLCWIEEGRPFEKMIQVI